jgi:nitrogen-specific signal transduction histidine kinase/ActR/RegA family two-component response regulator
MFDDKPAILSTFTDISERKRLEQELYRSKKMDALGRLAGGIAHDFNNLLTVIVGCSALLEEQVRSSPEASGALADLRAAADRAASLTRQLLAFGRRQFLQARALQLNDVVMQVQVMLRRVIGDEITLEVALDPALRLVRADPAQIEQVIVNLVLNARDAMPDGGVVKVTTRNRRVDEVEDGLAPGEYVELAVSDTGVGIDPAAQARLFEPFFTTKGPRGTGLGLATVYGIVKQSGGTVRFESEVGKGTRFEVLLPAAAEALPATEPEPAPAIPVGGSEHVLVVEDEAAVRSLIASTLSRQGYAVSQACDGVDALDVLERLGRIDLLVTDVRMPRMNGLALFAEVQRRCPGVPALLISGDSAPEVAAGADAAQPLFLQKPFTPAQLLQATREALSRRSVPAAR